MPDLIRTFSFTGKASFPKNAIGLIYDLEGFSRFFNQPDVQDYVPMFLNHVSKAIEVCLLGGSVFWESKEPDLTPLPLRLVREKFLGDGALYIFHPPKGEQDFPGYGLSNLCNRLWNLQNAFDSVISKMGDEIPLFEVPRRIRFGLARGSIYELRTSQGAGREYIGFCVNLASRLQKYCTQLAFIASARLQIPSTYLQKHKYIKVVATQIKGFPKELVIVDQAG